MPRFWHLQASCCVHLAPCDRPHRARAHQSCGEIPQRSPLWSCPRRRHTLWGRRAGVANVVASCHCPRIFGGTASVARHNGMGNRIGHWMNIGIPTIDPHWRIGFTAWQPYGDRLAVFLDGDFRGQQEERLNLSQHEEGTHNHQVAGSNGPSSVNGLISMSLPCCASISCSTSSGPLGWLAQCPW